MSKLWELQQFDKRTFRTELERIPEFDTKQHRRPGSHLPSLHKPQQNRAKTKVNLATYEPTVMDDKLRKVMRSKRSQSIHSIPSETDGMMLTFLRPQELPELVALPPPTTKHSGLSKILSNRHNYIDGYFDSIRQLRDNRRGQSHSPASRQFDPVKVGPWVVRGQITANVLVLRGFDEESDRHLVRKYQWTKKLAAKVEQNYQQWATSKFLEG